MSFARSATATFTRLSRQSVRTAQAPLRSLHSQPSIRSDRYWQYGAVAFLTVSGVVLTSTRIHLDAEVAKRRPNPSSPSSANPDSEYLTASSDPSKVPDHPDTPAQVPSAPPTEGLRVVSAAELSNHTTEAAGIWVAIDGVVYDITEFATSGAHPGGTKVLLQNSGKDATSVYKPLHPPSKLVPRTCGNDW